MRARVYFDGFNFYYRLFKNDRRIFPPPARFNWLDLLRLSKRVLPHDDIDWIGYFTAFVRANPHDPDQHLRQRAYLEALQTIPCLEIVPGTFQPAKKWGVPCATPTVSPVEFDTFEEKGSDVNLASRLVWDGSRKAFDHALVVSNDSDLSEAIRIVNHEMGLPVSVRSPDLTVNNVLKAVATDARPLDTKLLKYCLFPETLTNAAGIPISRPTEWS